MEMARSLGLSTRNRLSLTPYSDDATIMSSRPSQRSLQTFTLKVRASLECRSQPEYSLMIEESLLIYALVPWFVLLQLVTAVLLWREALAFLFLNNAPK